jgi:hypothetical protein
VERVVYARMVGDAYGPGEEYDRASELMEASMAIAVRLVR